MVMSGLSVHPKVKVKGKKAGICDGVPLTALVGSVFPLYLDLMIQYVMFGQNPLFSSKENIRKPYFGKNLTFQCAGVTFKRRSRSPKSKQLFSQFQLELQSMVNNRIYPLFNL